MRFTVAARAAAVRHAERRRGQGATLAQAAAELGVGYMTLRRWTRGTSRPLRAVAVVAEQTSAGGELVAVLHGGVRVAGLSIEDVARLARLLA